MIKSDLRSLEEIRRKTVDKLLKLSRFDGFDEKRWEELRELSMSLCR